MLQVESINCFYGQSQALFNVSLEVGDKEVVALLGRNGAGKSTTLKAIMGINPPRTGRIIHDGEDVTGLRPHEIARRGIGYVPEDRRLFPGLTVMDNLRVAAIGTNDFVGIDESLHLFPKLRRYLDTKARNLSGGEQKMLAMARGMIGHKELLLMDEPTEGLAPSIVQTIKDALLKIRGEASIMLVEQNTPLALEIADRIYIVRNGSIVFEGEPKEVQENKKVQSYLTVTHEV